MNARSRKLDQAARKAAERLKLQLLPNTLPVLNLVMAQLEKDQVRNWEEEWIMLADAEADPNATMDHLSRYISPDELDRWSLQEASQAILEHLQSLVRPTF